MAVYFNAVHQRYGWLSNLAVKTTQPISFGGIAFPSVEHPYQYIHMLMINETEAAEAIF